MELRFNPSQCEVTLTATLSIFIKVMTFEDLKELGDEEAVKKAGKLRQQGKKYVVQDADVIFFKVTSLEVWIFVEPFLVLYIFCVSFYCLRY